MKRDMDLVRRIVLATADLPYGERLESLEGVEPEAFVMHALWMTEAGLIDAQVQAGSGSFAMYASIGRLTWQGCEFADAVADDRLWNKAKENVLKPGISFTFDVLKEWLKAEISQGLPALRALA